MQDDAYLAHASENAHFATALTEALRGRGLRVWFNNFLVGPSIREQMEHGLANADFGVVVLSPEFFAKKWTQYELDAMFALEDPGEVRILPVWVGVTAEEVRARSPMLAMRSAAIYAGDIDQVADALLKSMTTLAATRSPSRLRRFEVSSGFPWSPSPMFLPSSAAAYDENFDDYAFTALATYPEVRSVGSTSRPVPLGEVLRGPLIWDGRAITVIGKQVPGTVQVFEEIVAPEDMLPHAKRPLGLGAGIVAYVFQLHSVDFRAGELCFVHCIGPYNRDSPGWGPHPPDPDWLCWVTGMVLAYGRMPNTSGRSVNAMYIVAKAIMFTPPFSEPE